MLVRPSVWQLIAKNRKRRLALQTALRTVYQRRQLLLRVAFLTVLLLANNNGAAVLSRSCRRFQRNVGWFTNVWSTYSEKRFKETFRIFRSTFMFLLGHIRNLIEKDTITEEPISPEGRLAICLYRKYKQISNLYFVSMKHEQHISIMLRCGVSNDFL